MFCTLIVQIMSNLAKYHQSEISTFVRSEFCQFTPKIFKSTCQSFINLFGDKIIDGLIKKYAADMICLGIGYCTDKKCRISSLTSLKE